MAHSSSNHSSEDNQQPPSAVHAWLVKGFVILLIIVNALAFVCYGLVIWLEHTSDPAIGHVFSEIAKQFPHYFANGVLESLALISIGNVFALINLRRGYRWAFWLYVVLQIATLLIFSYMGQFLSGLANTSISTLLLFALLNLNGKHSAWAAMK